MQGMDKNTGKTISGRAHLKQRLDDILTTPLGSRVMRRDYGSRLPRLVDRPINASLKLDLVHATAEAIARWENELILKRVRLSQTEPEHLMLDLEGVETISGEPIRIEGISL